jgi:hypothetical protein
MVYTLTVHLYANDKPDSIERIKAKLIEAARVYRSDKETVDWFVMQDVHDPRAFTIVERFEQESVRTDLASMVLLLSLTPLFLDLPRECCIKMLNYILPRSTY